MERPVMNPTFVSVGPAQGHTWVARLRPVVRPLWVAVRGILRFLFRDLFGSRTNLKDEVGTPVGRWMRAVCYRAIFLPLFMALLACALVYCGTHPPAVAAVMDPTCHGIYYDPVDFLSEDGTQLEGWLIPVLDAKKILAEKEKALAEHHAAVVLVHDFGASRQQMLPLVRPLHDAGYVVFVVGLRGNGLVGQVGSTFGFNEANDVKAALELLRKTPFVDRNRIGVLGLGTGATASILAAVHDPGIMALIVDRPSQSLDQVIHDNVAPRQAWLQWINPVCVWTFEIAYRVNAPDMDLEQCFNRLQGRPTLVFNADTDSCLKGEKRPQIIDFLDANLKPKKAVE